MNSRLNSIHRIPTIRLALVLMLIFRLSFSVTGQHSDNSDYVGYFNICNNGDRYFHYKKYDSALRCYESAFKGVPYIHTRYLEKAATCASKLNDKVAATGYLKIALKQGNDSKYLSTGKFKRHQKLPEYKKLKDSLSYFHSIAVNKHNKTYQRIIDSLFVIDQAIRNGDRNYITRKDDSLNYSCLLKQFKIYGYPSEKLVGQEMYENAFIIILHSVRAPGNEKYLDLIEEYVKTGDCLPEDYAWMTEDSYLFRGLEPPYYFNNEGVLGMSQEEKQRINAERKKIGMKPIEAYRVFKIGRITGMAEKW